jgi:osmotically-inducible protein OsmY
MAYWDDYDRYDRGYQGSNQWGGVRYPDRWRMSSGDEGYAGGRYEYNAPYYGYGYGGYGDYGNRGVQGYGNGWYGNAAGQRPNYAGRGPRNYHRSDERIREDVNDYLARNPDLDASDIDVRVENSEVTLSGVVEDRSAKRLAEDITDDVFGVSDVHNDLKIRHGFLACVTGEKASDREIELANEREESGSTRRATRAGKSGTRPESEAAV